MSVTRLTRIGPEEGEGFEHEWVGGPVRCHMLSDVGKKRPHNEDSCMMSVPKYTSQVRPEPLLFAVADGMGGASAGERASRIALETLVDELAPNAGEAVPDALRAAIQRANRRVFEESASNAQYEGMGTTMSVVALCGDCAYVGQVGDSRAYLARPGSGLRQLTDDHSVVAEQVRKGLLTEEEARTHSLKNLITRAIGIKEQVEIDLFAVRVKRGDTLLICSDGLSNMVGDTEIARVLGLRNLQGAARRLVGRALDEGGLDNITAVLVRIIHMPPRAVIQEGAQQVTVPSGGLKGLFGVLLRR